MKILGITGGMGSGKSYVSRLLTTQYGIPVYDCDTQAKRLNEESPEIRNALVALVGTNVYDDKGHLVKPILANYLFQSQENQARVNAIIHPVVRKDFMAWCKRQQAEIVGIESAILFESGFWDMASAIASVSAPIPLRIQRAVQRDHSTPQQAEQRIRLQMSDQEREARSQFVIQNDGTPLHKQIQEMVGIMHNA